MLDEKNIGQNCLYNVFIFNCMRGSTFGAFFVKILDYHPPLYCSLLLKIGGHKIGLVYPESRITGGRRIEVLL